MAANLGPLLMRAVFNNQSQLPYRGVSSLTQLIVGSALPYTNGALYAIKQVENTIWDVTTTPGTVVNKESIEFPAIISDWERPALYVIVFMAFGSAMAPVIPAYRNSFIASPLSEPLTLYAGDVLFLNIGDFKLIFS